MLSSYKHWSHTVHCIQDGNEPALIYKYQPERWCLKVVPLVQERVTLTVRWAWAHRSTGLAWWTTRSTPSGMPPCSSPSGICTRTFCASPSMTGISTLPMVRLFFLFFFFKRLDLNSSLFVIICCVCVAVHHPGSSRRCFMGVMPMCPRINVSQVRSVPFEAHADKKGGKRHSGHGWIDGCVSVDGWIYLCASLCVYVCVCVCAVCLSVQMIQAREMTS